MANPGYWQDETSGVLRPAVIAYLDGGDMTPEQIAAMRAYLRQWMAGFWFGEDEIEALRAAIDGLVTQGGDHGVAQPRHRSGYRPALRTEQA